MLENAHSILPPSSAHIWGAPNGCTGWVKMMESVPEQESTEAALDGEASHEIGEQIIKRETGSGNWPVLKEGETASNGVVVTDEMIEGAELYAGNFLGVFWEHADILDIKAGTETRVEINRVHQKCFGTVDAWLYDPAMNILYIWDYKFGHLFVEVFENLQAICYAGGLAREHSIPEDCKVVFRIVQPRTFTSEGPVREWKTTMAGLLPYFTTLSTQAAKALSDRAELNTGPHCRYCDARFNCQPATQAGVGLFELAAKPLPMDASPELIGLQLSIVQRAAEQLKALGTGYEEQLKSLIKSGKAVPGWGVQPAEGREGWTCPVEQVISLGELLGLNLGKPGVVTPNQARKLGMDEATIGALSARKQNGLKLIKETGVKLKKLFS